MSLGSNLKISVIIVCLNSKDLIEKTLDSVINQSYKNIEIVFIDGGSTDGSLEIIKKYNEKIDFFCSEKDNGIYEAMNKGVIKSTGDVIYFLNCGDIFYNNSIIERIAALFCENSDLIYGNIVEYSPGGDQHLIQMFRAGIIQIINSGIHHQAIFADRKLFFEKNNFNLNYKLFADYNWILDSVIQKNARIRYVDFPICYFLSGGFSQMNYKKYSFERLSIIFRHIVNKPVVGSMGKYPRDTIFLLLLLGWLSFHSIKKWIKGKEL